MKTADTTFTPYYKELAENYDNSEIISENDIEKINTFLQKNFINTIDETYFDDNGLNKKFFDELKEILKNKFNDEKLIKYILDGIQKYNDSSIFQVLPIEDRTIGIKTSFLINLDIKSFFEKENFEQSISEGFFPISYTKLENGYYTKAITSNLQYLLRIDETGKFQLSKKLDFNPENIENFLEQEQASIKLGGLNNKAGYINPAIKIIPIEKIEKLNLDRLKDYIYFLEEDIEKNLNKYKKRVIQIQKNGSKDF